MKKILITTNTHLTADMVPARVDAEAKEEVLHTIALSKEFEQDFDEVIYIANPDMKTKFYYKIKDDPQFVCASEELVEALSNSAGAETGHLMKEGYKPINLCDLRDVIDTNDCEVKIAGVGVMEGIFQTVIQLLNMGVKFQLIDTCIADADREKNCLIDVILNMCKNAPSHIELNEAV